VGGVGVGVLVGKRNVDEGVVAAEAAIRCDDGAGSGWRQRLTVANDATTTADGGPRGESEA
jgi:hypothetical protein